MKERFWEIDAIRGLAILKILIFNWSFALFYLGIVFFEEGLMFQGAAAAVFIFLAGLSLTISYSRVKHLKTEKIYKKYFSRGIKILSYGLLITIITYFTFPEATIIFGILHFIAFSVILGQFFLKYNKENLYLGIILILVGLYLQTINVDYPWLLWLGFIPKGFSTFDYFPILPWFGITLLGIYFGNSLYDGGKRNFKIPKIENSFIVKVLSFLGRNSLFIYLAHQPLLILILLLLGYKIF